MLEAGPSAGIFPALADAQDRPNKGFQPGEVLSGICSIRPAESESSGYPREIRSDREAESLARWDNAEGVFEVENRAPQADELTGGEHFVTLDASGGTVYKSTHPGKYGFGADVEMVHPRGRNAIPRITAGLVDATPEEYLFRLAKQNELFGDDIQIMGAVRYPQGVSVLTTQPFYKGTRTEQPIIDSWFEAMRMEEIAIQGRSVLRRGERSAHHGCAPKERAVFGRWESDAFRRNDRSSNAKPEVKARALTGDHSARMTLRTSARKSAACRS